MPSHLLKSLETGRLLKYASVHYRHVFGLQSWNLGYSSLGDMNVEDLDLNEGGGTENFTAYTEDDPFGYAVVTASKIAVTGMKATGKTYVHDDKGAAHFGASFTHDFTVTPGAVSGINTTNSVYMSAWGVSNVVDDAWTLWQNQGSALTLAVRYSDAQKGQFVLWNLENRTHDLTAPNFWDPDTPTPYYNRVVRTGPNAVEARIYSNPGRTSLLDTLEVPIATGSGHLIKE